MWSAALCRCCGLHVAYACDAAQSDGRTYHQETPASLTQAEIASNHRQTI